MKKYPQKEDIAKHTEQLSGNIRQYLLGFDKNADFVRNALNCLFSDFVLELRQSNLNGVLIDDLTFNTFLNKISKVKK